MTYYIQEELHQARQATIKQLQEEGKEKIVDRSSVVCYAPVIFDDVTPLQQGMAEARQVLVDSCMASTGGWRSPLRSCACCTSRRGRRLPRASECWSPPGSQASRRLC